MKFLVDECLSPELTQYAHAKGYGESSHVVWLGCAAGRIGSSSRSFSQAIGLS
jgi:predicted nuclease of predicted toxin-antitoxin system